MRRQGYLIGAALCATTLTAATASAAGGISIVTSTDTVTSDGPSTHAANCDTGDQVLGGGFSLPDGQNFAQKSKPLGHRGWRAEVLSPAGDVSTYALCQSASARRVKLVVHSVRVAAPAKRTPGAAFKRGTGPGTSVEQGVNATCDKGWQVISGGYAVRPPFRLGNRGEIAVDTSRRSGARTWQVHGGNDGAPTKLAAFALCERQGVSQIDQVANTNQITAPGTQSATATCATGSHLVGGGFKTRPDEQGGAFPVVSTSMPVDAQNWKVTYTPAGPGSFTSYAECEQD